MNLNQNATYEDYELLNKVHPLSSKLLHSIGKHTSIMKLPKIGYIVSEANLIREIFLDRKNFTKVGEGASSSFWNPIIGEYGLVNMDGDLHKHLKREPTPVFSNKIIPKIAEQSFPTDLQEQRKTHHQIDIVEEASLYAYKSLWNLIGLETTNLTKNEELKLIRTLRSTTNGLNLTKKKLTTKQVTTVQEKLSYIEKLTRDNFKTTTNPESIAYIMKKAGYDEEAVVSIVKSLMITGTETIISFLPRMTALFIKTNLLEKLETEPQLIDQSIEEALRVTVPTPVAARIARRNMEFHNKNIKKGDRFILSTIEASKKYGIFNPQKPVPREIKGLWFGAGIHMCIGIPLALAEAKKFTEELIKLNTHQKLKILQSTPDTKGHTGSYKELIIQ